MVSGRHYRIVRCVGATLLMTAAFAGQPAAGQETPPPSTREFIVKFKPGSAGDRAAAEAMQDPSRQPAAFAGLSESLGGETGIPVHIAAVTSGRELVMAVDSAAVTSAVLAGLTERPGVVRAIPLDTGPSPQAIPRDPVIAVEFTADSPIGRRLAAGRPEPLAEDPAFRELQDDIARIAGVPLAPLPNAVAFTLDVGRLTTELGDRLKQRADVEYVQPNALVQPLPQ
jgi:hypothetical protein